RTPGEETGFLDLCHEGAEVACERRRASRGTKQQEFTSDFSALMARRPASLTCAMRALKSLVNSCCLVPRLARLRSSTSVRVAGSGAGVGKGVLRTSVGFIPS